MLKKSFHLHLFTCENFIIYYFYFYTSFSRHLCKWCIQTWWCINVREVGYSMKMGCLMKKINLILCIINYMLSVIPFLSCLSTSRAVNAPCQLAHFIYLINLYRLHDSFAVSFREREISIQFDLLSQTRRPNSLLTSHFSPQQRNALFSSILHKTTQVMYSCSVCKRLYLVLGFCIHLSVIASEFVWKPIYWYLVPPSLSGPTFFPHYIEIYGIWGPLEKQ